MWFARLRSKKRLAIDVANRDGRRAAVTARRAAIFEPLESRQLLSTTFYVSLKGNDNNPGTDPSAPWRTIQHAMDVATPGSTVDVKAGIYNEKLSVNVSGNATDGFITFQADGRVFISGLHKTGQNIVQINNQNYVRIVGFNICNDIGVNNGSGIRLTSGGDHIELRNNRIFNILGRSAMGITVYGSDPTRAISNLVIDGNEIFRATPAPSEALTLNGNVHDFAVTNNYVHQVNGIGIDCISGEGICPDPTMDIVHDGVVSGNRVFGVHFGGGSRDAAGITIDGANNVVVERNTIWLSDVGIEVGCVNPALVATNVKVRDNLVFFNAEAGIQIGATDATLGRVQGCDVTNNTLFFNASNRDAESELRVRWGSQYVLENNIIVARPGKMLIEVESGATGVTSDYNEFYNAGGAGRSRFEWGGQTIVGLTNYRNAGAQDTNTIFAMPKVVNKPGKLLRIAAGSAGINQGDPLMVFDAGETDIDGDTRVLGGRVDIGADERA
jgi:hypothetical protein